MAKKINPNTLPMYKLRYKINKHTFEVLGRWFLPAIAYGMRKELIQEYPEKYSILNKLIVKQI